MRQLDNLEVKRAAILKAARAQIRLKHALRADEEINQVLPELERRVNEALANGEGFTFDPAEVLREIEN